MCGAVLLASHVSAYINTGKLLSLLYLKSSIKLLNKRGPRVGEACGTPQRINLVIKLP
jgi:hypothetical protein